MREIFKHNHTLPPGYRFCHNNTTYFIINLSHMSFLPAGSFSKCLFGTF